MKARKSDWIVAGGKPGELAHCTRCGEGLEMVMPQRIEIVTAVSKAFIKIHSRCADTGRTEERPRTPSDWSRGRDTGISSGTIYHVLTGNPAIYRSFDVPHDPSDFGRCYRLLQLFPSWTARLPEVADKFPAWKPFVAAWPELTQLYEKALASNAGGAMYARMAQLQGQL